MNFDRLRFVAERAEVGEEREALFAVTIPEERGSFRRFCELLGAAQRHRVQLPHLRRAARRTSSSASPPRDRGESARDRRARSPTHGFAALDLTDDELAKLHVRHMVGGRSRWRSDERLYRFEFPERPGALMRFLSQHAPGLEHQPVPLPQPGRRLRPHPGRHPGPARRARPTSRPSSTTLAYPCVDETDNPVYRLFLR